MKRTPSVMTHNFQDTPRADIPRSSFDRSHGVKTTFNAGWLVPFYVDEALPGDTFNLKATAFARMSTPIKPLFDNLFMETFFFSVPIRQVWDNWEKFNGEQANPTDSTDFLVPQIAAPTNIGNLTLADYMGVPTNVPLVDGWSFNSLHFRAYNHIWNNWFRNQNLIDSAPMPTGDGPDDIQDFPLARRMKRPDYFTSSLPWPQKGAPVSIPLGNSAPVIEDPNAAGQVPTFINSNGISGVLAWNAEDTVDQRAAWNVPSGGTGLVNATWDDPGLIADLSQAQAVTINDLRQAFQVQKILERDARGGTRYPEILQSHFGVTDPQMLVLQRPEFLGGGSTAININPVAQTSPQFEPAASPTPTPQGNLSAYATASFNNHGFTKSFTEHCLLIGLVNVRADLNYQQGLNRMWSRQTRFDYYWPALAHIGEQEVLNKEIFVAADSTIDELVFGYQERYAEYRYKPSMITGKFRSTDPESLDVWHLAQDFASTPALDQVFIEDNPPMSRVLAVQDEPQFLFDCFIKLKCARPMPLYGTPGMIDHF